MPSLLIAGLLAITSPAASGLASDGARMAAPAETRVELAQVIFHSRVVIRVQTETAPQAPPRDAWRERKGPRCVPMSDILGAAIMVPNSVDLALRGGQRIRARFGASCPGLDYYSGFYIVPPSDGQICADRDVVRDRAGGECAVDKFRRLSPRK